MSLSSFLKVILSWRNFIFKICIFVWAHSKLACDEAYSRFEAGTNKADNAFVAFEEQIKD